MPQFDVGNIGAYLYDLLGWSLAMLGIHNQLITLIQKFATGFVLLNFVLLTPIFTIWLERKFVARFQDRLGPNRVGPYGLFQSFADIVKLITKEDIIPSGADRVIFSIGPVLSVVSVVGIWTIIPFASTMVGANINVGILYSVAIGALGTLAIMMGGWSSNNKYALLGAFRTAAQLVSYEVPLIVALLVPTMLAGSMGMTDIVDAQDVWFIVSAPIAAVLFLVASIAEVGRTPFDLQEAESEIVAGFHVEYTGMKFGVWMLGEFVHAFTIAALTAVLFLGGWRGPFADQVPILGVFYFLGKTYLVYLFTLWIRVTLPRIRIDQMNNLNWKVLVPLSLAMLVMTAVVYKAVPSDVSLTIRSLILFVANVVLVAVLFAMLTRVSRKLQSSDRMTSEDGGIPVASKP